MIYPEMDKARLLARLYTEYDFFNRTLAGFAPEQMTLPGVAGEWSVKDVVAHLNAWLRQAIEWAAAIQRGSQPDIPALPLPNIDAVNAAFHRADQDRPLAEILAEFERSYRRIVGLVEALDEADLFERPASAACPEPLWRLLADNSFEHFYEHAVTLRVWLAAQGGG